MNETLAQTARGTLALIGAIFLTVTSAWAECVAPPYRDGRVISDSDGHEYQRPARRSGAGEGGSARPRARSIITSK
jgi:hypothetical protein